MFCLGVSLWSASLFPPLEGEFGLPARALSCCLGLVLASFDCEMRFPSVTEFRPKKPVFRPVSSRPGCLHRLAPRCCLSFAYKKRQRGGKPWVEVVWSGILLEVQFSWLSVEKECLISESPQVVNLEASSKPAFAFRW